MWQNGMNGNASQALGLSIGMGVSPFPEMGKVLGEGVESRQEPRVPSWPWDIWDGLPEDVSSAGGGLLDLRVLWAGSESWAGSLEDLAMSKDQADHLSLALRP